MNLEDFIAGYIGAALWTCTFDEGEETGLGMDSKYYRSDIHPDSMKVIREECEAFVSQNKELLTKAVELRYVVCQSFSEACSSAGHDFWLTRCRHGAGYWDRSHLRLDGLGQRLSEAARLAGDRDLYVGDDGQIHYSN